MRTAAPLRSAARQKPSAPGESSARSGSAFEISMMRPAAVAAASELGTMLMSEEKAAERLPAICRKSVMVP